MYDQKQRKYLEDKLQQLYSEVLQGENAGKSFPIKPPVSWNEFRTHIPEFMEWSDFWHRKSPFYQVEFGHKRGKDYGDQHDVPVRMHFRTAEDMLAYLGKGEGLKKARTMYGRVTAASPELGSFFLNNIEKLLKEPELLEPLLALAEYFRGKCRRNCYLRELDVPHVHTKFIEKHQALVTGVFSALHPEEGIKNFADFCASLAITVKAPAPNIYLRSLDGSLTFGGLREVMVTKKALSALDLPFRRVFVTENKINGYTFPECEGGLVIFGAGNGLISLDKRAAWLEQVQGDWLARVQELCYWGDLDRDGFRILARFREQYPRVRSLLMNRETFEAYRDFAVADQGDKGPCPEALTEEERETWHYLAGLPVRENRLEQEKIPIAAVKRSMGQTS